jgi:hypothetical protein
VRELFDRTNQCTVTAPRAAAKPAGHAAAPAKKAPLAEVA